jgi:hypothetical protein
LFLYPRPPPPPEALAPGPTVTTETDLTPTGATQEYVPGVVYTADPTGATPAENPRPIAEEAARVDNKGIYNLLLKLCL